MMPCGADALEGRDMAAVDIPGAFMHANVDETVHARREGTMAKLFARLDPNMHRKCTAIKNGELVLCVALTKALCGTLRTALLF